jgi:hypothetical protein
LAAVATLALAAPAAVAQHSPSEASPPAFRAAPIEPQPLTVREKFNFYADKTFGLETWFVAGASAGYRQAIDSPPEWGQGMEGYSKRLGSVLARRAIKNTVEFSVGAALREDPRYYGCDHEGFALRLWHAVASTFVTRRDDGVRVPDVGRVSGAMAAGFASNAWYPDRLSDTSHAFSRAGIMLGGDAVLNVLREFMPDMKRKLRGR